MPHLSVELRALLLVPALLTASACGGDDSLTSPTNGTIEVTTVTGGPEPDEDGYTVQLDDQAAQPIGPSASVQMADIEAGSHTVHLAGLAPNCTVAENPMTATVSAGQTAAVNFAVTCTPTTGGIQVSSTTGGPSPDADGYTLTIDGAEQGALGATGTLTVEGLSLGAHAVGLSGLAANCQLQGDNPRTVDVLPGANATIAFQVTCTEPPLAVGTLRITTVTTGADRDANGYTIAVDAGSAQPIGINTAISLTNVTAGSHSVRLTGVATNCAVQGTNPRTVPLAPGNTAEVSFAVTCTATTGTIRVNVSTTGSQVDPNLYLVKVDGGNPGRRLPASGSVTFTAVRGGNHTVALSDVASNCTVTDGTSKTAAVTTGATAEVAFAVTCTATTGVIQVAVTSSGAPPDADGFSAGLDQNGPTQAIPGIGGSVPFNGVTAGTHTVVLTGVAPNCSVTDGASKNVDVVAGGTVNVAFTVVCSATGETWASIELPANFRAYALWAASPSFLFVAGSYPGTSSQSVILHYDGGKWTEQFLGQGDDQRTGFGGTTPNDVFAVVGSGAVLQHESGNWANVGPQDANDELNYASIWPSSGEIFAGGFISAMPDGGLLSHYDGSWTIQPPEGHRYGSNGLVYDLSGISPADVYALGQSSPSGADPAEQYTEYLISHYDGIAWTESFMRKTGAAYPDGYSLTGLWAVAPNDVFVVGSGGHIDRYNGAEAVPMVSPTTGSLADVWGNTATNVYAVGEAGTLHYDGLSWTIIDPRAASRVWGTAEEVFVLTPTAVLHAEH